VKYIRETYKPDELLKVIALLQNNSYHNFHENDARGIVIALHQLGYRIIKTGIQNGKS